MSSLELSSSQLIATLEWLASEPEADPARELRSLAAHYQQLIEAAPNANQFHRCLDLFCDRAIDLAECFKPHLFNVGLPLTRELHAPAKGLAELLVDLASGCMRVLEDESHWLARTQRHGRELLAVRALNVLREAWLVSAMGGMNAPFQLWARAHGIFALVGPGTVGEAVAANLEGQPVAESVVTAYKRLLAFPAAQPEGFSPRELDWIEDFLETDGWRAELVLLKGAVDGGFWIDPAQDAPPVAVVRRAPPPVDGLFHLSAAPLAKRIGEYLETMEALAADAGASGVEGVGGVTAIQAELPQGLAPREALALMRNLRECWVMPPMREQARRRSQYKVEVCAGLKSIWEMVRKGEKAANIVEWVVLNESPGGFAIMSVTGVSGTLSAGMALALRRERSHPWSICIVRWIRSDNPSQVELGLQVVASGAIPVRVGFRGSEPPAMVSAVVLPPLGAMRRHQAILAPTGTYRSRRFVFVYEDERVYVAQGRLLSLDMQTASVELFQFEVDPYPI